MRGLVFLTIFILIGGFAYIGFSVLTFETDAPRRYNLSFEDVQNEVDPAVIKSGLSSQEQKKRDQIVGQLENSIQTYNNNWVQLPEQAQGIINNLVAAIIKGTLPALYPVTNDYDRSVPGKQNFVELSPLSLDVLNVPLDAPENTVSKATCVTREGFLIGDTGANALSCEQETDESVRMYLSGPDNDKIVARGNSIIDSGSGNDRVEIGKEFAMIYVSPSFGLNSVFVDCSDSRVNATGRGSILPWDYEFRNFIVFDPQISKKDIIVQGNSIRHKKTKDQIMLNQNCFNIIFTADE